MSNFLRALIRKLANDTQLVDKLAESGPIRRAAQLGAYAYHKGKAISEETLDKAQKNLPPEVKDKLRDLNDTFKKYK